MLLHSVEAPAEQSVGLFSVADVEFIAQFISTTFYRHFKAYSYTFYNEQPDEKVERVLMVEHPLAPRPLSEGIADPSNEPPAPAPEGDAVGEAAEAIASAEGESPAE